MKRPPGEKKMTKIPENSRPIEEGPTFDASAEQLEAHLTSLRAKLDEALRLVAEIPQLLVDIELTAAALREALAAGPPPPIEPPVEPPTRPPVEPPPVKPPTRPPTKPPANEVPEPPAEPVIVVPTARDFIYRADERACEPVSDRARQALSKFTGEFAMPRAASWINQNFPSEMPVIEVRGRCPDNAAITLAGGWDPNQNAIVGVGDVPANVCFVGGSADASLPLGVGSHDPAFGKAGRLEAHRLEIRVNPTAQGILQEARIGTLIFNEFTFAPSDLLDPGDYHDHCIHFGYDYGLFVLRGMKRNPNFKWRQHAVYDKGGGDFFLLDCDLFGGNRSWTQHRPDQLVPIGAGGGAQRRGVYYVARCTGDSYGWNWPSEDGGAALTQWSSPDKDSWYIDNRVIDARYGALVVSGQGPDKGNFLGWNGRANGRVFLLGNTFENLRSPRACVNVSSVDEVFIGEGNTILGGNLDLLIDGPNSIHKGGVGRVVIARSVAEALAARGRVATGNGAGGIRHLTGAEVLAMAAA